MDAATRTTLTARVEQAVGASVMPAYNTLAAYFETLRPKATRNDGVWALPQGDQFYRYAIESNTTTTMGADEIHALGLAEVARIGAEMDRILRDAGYTEGTLGERMDKLAKSPAQLYPDTDRRSRADSRRLRDHHQGNHGRARSVLRHQAQGRGRGRARSAVRGKDGAGRLLQPAAARRFEAGQVLRQSARRPRYAQVRHAHDCAYHEAVPGHHLQAAIAQEIKGLPIFRSVISVHRVHRRLGALCRTARLGGGLREGPARQPGPPAGRDVPRRAPRGRHRPAQQALDARAGDRLHGRATPACPRPPSSSRSSGISSTRARPWRTRWACSRSWSCASARRPRWAASSTSASFTTKS